MFRFYEENVSDVHAKLTTKVLECSGRFPGCCYADARVFWLVSRVLLCRCYGGRMVCRVLLCFARVLPGWYPWCCYAVAIGCSRWFLGCCYAAAGVMGGVA